MSPQSPHLRIDRCVCRQRDFAELLRLAQLNGWDLDALASATGCSRQCGLCRPYLRRMLTTGETVFHEILVEAGSGEQ